MRRLKADVVGMVFVAIAAAIYMVWLFLVAGVVIR
jgi:hypothetical protein